MAVQCANCGEELLGSVNRCWQCGKLLESRPDSVAGLPPVRREPGVVAATVAPENAAESDAAESPPAPADSAAEPASGATDEDAVRSPFTGQAEPSPDAEPESDAAEAAEDVPPVLATAADSNTPPRRMPGVVYHGSPFAPTSQPRPAMTTAAPAAAPSYPQNAAAGGGAIASLCLGVMSLAVATVFWTAPVVALILALLGICMGIWGMYSNRRGIAGLGLFLCIGAFGWSGFMGVVQLYTMIHGVDPFTQTLEDPEVEGLDPE